MKSPDRPTVPEAAEALRAYYAIPGREMGGSVHVITEDANTDQATSDSCVEHAHSWGDEWGGGFVDDDERIARMLAEMTPTQRGKLANMSFYPS